MACTHDLNEREVACAADGMCPICAYADGFHAGQEDMRERAAKECTFWGTGISCAIGIRALAVKYKP